ncbi:MAG TPA: penicillin-binding protein [Spirochaetia bacterium]|nr:penicillin-binding protein [Spirochaetia bacterium]
MEKSNIRLRYIIVFAVTGAFAIALLIQYASVMVFGHRVATTPGDQPSVVERGPILDRNGKILAIQTQLNTVTVWGPNVTAPQETANLLSQVLGIPPAIVLDKIRGTSDYAVIERNITPTQSKDIRQLKSEGQLLGVSLQPGFARNYPEKSLASHLLGFVGIDNHGLAGIEYQYDKELSPPAVASPSGTVYGDQIFLTIDANAQYEMEKLARKAYDYHDAQAVMLLAMSARTGDVLAYAAYPDFDPNTFETAPPASLRNFPVNYMYEPGSVFKLFSLTSMMQLGDLTENDYFNADGIYNKVSPPVTDLGIYGRINVQGIIKYSSNVGASYASELVSKDNLYHMLREYGFGEQTGVDIPGEEKGIFRTPEFWTARSKPAISFGQEISVTAMQMITAATAIANHGVLLKPHVVKRIVAPDGRVVESFGRTPVREVISPTIADKMLGYMVTATQPGGTAIMAHSEEYDVAAKTGTAQVYNPKTGTYSPTDFIASCMGMFPANDPQIIVYTVIIDPRKNGYLGGIIAAPVVHDAIVYLGNYFNVPRKGDKLVDSRNRITVVRPQLPQFTDTIPDFTGLPKRQLMPLFDRGDLKVTITGDGWVASQSPPPGTKITKGMELHLELH